MEYDIGLSLSNLLEEDAISVPWTWKGKDYGAALMEKLKGFITLVINADNPLGKEVVKCFPSIITFCEKLSTCVNTALQGRVHLAFQIFEEAMGLVSSSGCELLRKNMAREFGTWYRIRKTKGSGEGDWLSEAGKIFHTPFDLRSKVADQRFSIQGLPCLYLGGSIHTCWLEMGRPPLNSMFVSAFCLRSCQKTLF